MINTSANDHPDSFHQASFDEAVRCLVERIRQERPQVLLTYPEDGSYGHPDHIKAHQITVAAFDAAADPSFAPEAGAPWRPLKLYYHLYTRGRMRATWEATRARGIRSPWGDSDEPPDRGQPDERVTTRIAVGPFVTQRRDALLAHRTQIRRDGWNFDPPPDLADLLYGEETFVCAQARVPVLPEETDFFAGIRPAGGE